MIVGIRSAKLGFKGDMMVSLLDGRNETNFSVEWQEYSP